MGNEKEEKTKRAANWQDHLGALTGGSKPMSSPFGGQKTMRHKEMDSANKRHAQQMALERERLALSKWETEMRMNLNMMEFEALKASRAQDYGLKRDYFDLDREKWEWERDQYGRGASDSLSGGGQAALKGGYIGGYTPGQAVQDYSVGDVFRATTRDERMKPTATGKSAAGLMW